MITLGIYETEFGHIQIAKQRRTGAVLYEQDGCSQSEADSQGVSLASYVHAIFGLIQQSGARNILLIGCGGGTMATMLVRSGQKATVVDVNPASFTIARTYFSMPKDVFCHVGDGKEFLHDTVQIFDAIVVDAYQGGQIPNHLQSVQFFNLVRDRLSLRGALFINSHLDHAFDRRAKHIADRVSQVFPNVRLLDSRGFRERNAIIMAGHINYLEPPQMLLPPEMGQAEIESELSSLEFRSWD
jgi:spermidine synthase